MWEEFAKIVITIHKIDLEKYARKMILGACTDHVFSQLEHGKAQKPVTDSMGE